MLDLPAPTEGKGKKGKEEDWDNKHLSSVGRSVLLFFLQRHSLFFHVREKEVNYGPRKTHLDMCAHSVEAIFDGKSLSLCSGFLRFFRLGHTTKLFLFYFLPPFLRGLTAAAPVSVFSLHDSAFVAQFFFSSY